MKTLLLRSMSWWALFVVAVVVYNGLGAVIWSAPTDPVGFLLGLVGLTLSLTAYAIVATGKSLGGLGQLFLTSGEVRRWR